MPSSRPPSRAPIVLLNDFAKGATSIRTTRFSPEILPVREVNTYNIYAKIPGKDPGLCVVPNV